jgi:hypothetical protein
MSFFERYELVRLLREGPSKSFEARERATGKPVLFHMLSGAVSRGAGPLPVDVRRLEQLPQVIEAGEFANAPYLVTECIEGFQSIEDWIREQVSAAPPSPIAEPPSPGAISSPGASGPGEFTRHFLGVAPAQSAPAAPIQPGTPDAGAAADWPVSSTEPGDFTRFFGPAMQAQPMDIEQEYARQQADPQPAAAPFAQPGEFTRMFGPAPGRSGQDTDSPLTGGLLSTSAELLIPQSKNAGVQPPESAAESGERPPSEYTRVISLPQPAADTQSEPASAAAPHAALVPGPRGGWRRWVIPVAVAAAAVLLALLALLLWTGRKPGETGKDAMGISSPAATTR